MEMMLDKKQNWVTFLFKFKVGHRQQQRQFTTSTKHLAKELLNIQATGNSRSFANEMRAFKIRSVVAGHHKLKTTNWKDYQSGSSYNYTRSWRTQRWPFYTCLAFEANWQGEKAKVHALWTDRKAKKSSSWSVVFSYSMEKQWTMSQLDCDMQWKVNFLWQLVTTSSVDGLRNSFKALPRSNLDQNRAMVTIW